MRETREGGMKKLACKRKVTRKRKSTDREAGVCVCVLGMSGGGSGGTAWRPLPRSLDTN